MGKGRCEKMGEDASMHVQWSCGCGREFDVLRAWRGGGLADSMSAAICPSKDVEEEGDEKVRGEGPRPRPATKVMKAHAQLRFVTVRREGKRARLVSVRARARDVIV